MSCVSQPEAPRYPDEESAYASQSSEINGRRASEANYNSSSRFDRSNNVRIKHTLIFLFMCAAVVTVINVSLGEIKK